MHSPSCSISPAVRTENWAVSAFYSASAATYKYAAANPTTRIAKITQDTQFKQQQATQINTTTLKRRKIELS
jgi:hypothetical protein